jgi:hypothetical protein
VPQSSPALPGGGFALHAVGVVVVLLAAHVPGPVRTLGAAGPLRLLGRVSYGVYLIHWPVFVWVDGDRVGHDGVVLLAVRLGITAALTAASFHLVEQPIRHRTAPLGRRGMALGLTAVTLVVATAAVVTTSVAADDGVLLALDELRPADVAPGVPVVPTVPPTTAPVPSDAVTAATAGPPTELRATEAPATTAAPTTTTTAPPVVDQVLLVGDSVMSQAHDHMLLRFAAQGVAIAYAGGPATGPLAPQGSWAEQVQGWVAAQDPDVVVLEACCNYTLEPEARYVDVDGTPVAPGSPAVAVAWEREVRHLLDLAGARGARVLLVRSPPVHTNGYYGDIEAHVATVNAIYDRIAAERPDIGLLDWGAVLAPDGTFTWDLPDATGAPVRVRLDDGVHLTPEGSDRVAAATVDAALAAPRRR